MLSKQYLAGFFDGDGSVGIRKLVKKEGNPAYNVAIVLSNTFLEILKLVEKQYGGFTYKNKMYNPNSKQGYQWKCSSLLAIKFLKDIFPFLVVKKARVEFVLNNAHLFHGKRWGKKGMPKKLTATRQKIFEECKKMNQQGLKSS